MYPFITESIYYGQQNHLLEIDKIFLDPSFVSQYFFIAIAQTIATGLQITNLLEF